MQALSQLSYTPTGLLLSMISLLFSKSVVHQQDLHYRHIFESF